MTAKRYLAFLAMIAVAALGFLGCGAPGDDRPCASNSGESFPDSGDGVGWPQWGGPNGNFKLAVDGLVAGWPDRGPIQLWSRSLGVGYAPIVASRGALFTLYRNGFEDVVIAIRAEDGETIWEHRYDARTRAQNETQFGEGPNASPVVVGDQLITLGYTGILNALDLATGEVRWTHDLIRDFGGQVLEFGNSASPIALDGQVFVLVGGEEQAVIAFEAITGEVAWKSESGLISYASPLIIDVDGQKQLVYFTPTQIVGLDVTNGQTLWVHPCRNKYELNASTPAWGPDNLLWVPTQLDGGTRVLRLRREGDETRVEQVWFNEEIGIHFWNSIRVGDLVYTSIGSKSSWLAAVNIHSGEVVWTDAVFEMANYIDTGKRAILLDGKGVLAIVALSSEGIEVLSSTRILDGVTWTAPTLVGTKLYIRDKKSIRALELSESAYSAGPRKGTRRATESS